MSILKGVIWGIICVAVGTAFFDNLSSFKGLDLIIMAVITVGSGIMSYSEFNE